MELNWSTFVLEIINFLVLLWILKRFLYRPVLAMIARRQQSIQDSLAAAKKMQDDAHATQEQYDRRLQEWEQEREKLRAALQQEMAAERARLQQTLQDELQQQREKARVLDERQQREIQHAFETQALKQAAQFAAKFLQSFASPTLEEQLLDLAARRIEELTDVQKFTLQTAPGRAVDPAIVATAFPLSAEKRGQWQARIAAICGCGVPVHFVEDGGLLAGIRITLGAWVLKANLCDELSIFAEIES